MTFDDRPNITHNKTLEGATENESRRIAIEKEAGRPASPAGSSGVLSFSTPTSPPNKKAELRLHEALSEVHALKERLGVENGYL